MTKRTVRLFLSAALVLAAALACVFYGIAGRTTRSEAVVRDGDLREEAGFAKSDAREMSADGASSAPQASGDNTRATRDGSMQTVPHRAPPESRTKAGPVFRPTREEIRPLRCAPLCVVRLSGDYPAGALRVRATLPSGAEEMCRTVTFSQMALFLVRTEAFGVAPGSIQIDLLDENDEVLDTMTIEVGKTGRAADHGDLIYEVTRHRAALLADAVVAEGILLPVGDPGRRELLRKLGQVRELLLAQLGELPPSTRDRLTAEMETNFARIEDDVRRRLAIHDGR